MNRIRRIASLAEFVPLFIASSALFILMLMTFADVMLRSTINAPIEAATEFTRILVALTVFAALPVVSGRGEHIAVDLLDPLLGKLATRLRDGLLPIFCGAMLYWPMQRIFLLGNRARDYGDVTEYLHIPQYLIAFGIGLSVAVTALVLICRGVLVLFDKPGLGETAQSAADTDEWV